MTKRPSFNTVTIRGGLLPTGLLDRIGKQDRDLEGVAPSDYHLASGERLGEAITRSWNRLLGVWERFTDRLADDEGALTGPTRQEWLLPLFQELGYGQLQAAPGFEIEAKAYPISHLWESVPVHLVGAGVDLDRRSPGVPGAATASPHGLVQEFLNRSDEYQWGIVSNGRRLRLLRDNASLTRSAYVEFDLEEMLEGEVYSDFALLWLTCHASRLEGPAGKQLLERWREEAARQGVRAMDALRDGVERAIEALGSAAVGHPSNHQLRHRLETEDLDPQDLYRQLLRVVYRILFLLVTESRDLLLDPDADPTARQRYHRYYSVTRLRNLAETTRGSSHTDLWRQLQVVSDALESRGEPALGLLPLGGFLWAAESTEAINDIAIPNSALLDAIRALTTVKVNGVVQRVDYANLGSEELGSIYESLLEYVPEVNPVAPSFVLSDAPGNERKTTGSYYTPTPLIERMLKEALDPLIAEAIDSRDPEQALLNLRIVDPAAGSGHFLIASANRLAQALARVRAEEEEPSPDQQRAALRDVVRRCIYAVDINPMAVELTNVALWLETMEPGKPLTFLDHHIRCGNGVIGASPAMLSEGVPDDVFTAKVKEGDDREACKHHKARNSKARSGQGNLFASDSTWQGRGLSAAAEQIAAMPEDTLEAVKVKQAAWSELIGSEDFHRSWLMGDAYCAAVTFPRTSDSKQLELTPYEVLYELRSNPDAKIPKQAIEAIQSEATRYRFFHWHLAFPEVFGTVGEGDDADRGGWSGGFDLVLGNPPWDTLSPDRREFFRQWIPDIASLSTSDQDEKIDEALQTSPTLSRRWDEHRQELFATARFFRRSGRYRMFAPGNLGKGDLNIYRAFVEIALTSIREGGFATQVTPSGLYGGANAAAIRRDLLDRLHLKTVWGFDNSDGTWFPGMGMKAFAVYVARWEKPTDRFDAAFGVRSLNDLHAATAAPYRYPVDTVRTIDAEALLIPEVRPGIDAHVMAKLTEGRETFGVQNRRRGWHPYRRELDMGNDAHLFTKDPSGLPVYEGRMIDFYDHRAKAYISGAGRSSKWTDTIPFDSPDKRIAPQWYVHEKDLPAKLNESWRRYRIGWLDVANPKSDPRCLAGTVVPRNVVCGDTVPTLSFPIGEEWRYPLWLAQANSLVMDFIARRRIGLHMKPYLMDGLPFAEIDPQSHLGVSLIERVLRLVCTTPEMEEFRLQLLDSASLPNDLGSTPAIDTNDRLRLRAQLDVLVATLVFGLDREEFEHVLDDFTILREREERPTTGSRPGYGEYLTKRLALDIFDSQDGNP